MRTKFFVIPILFLVSISFFTQTFGGSDIVALRVVGAIETKNSKDNKSFEFTLQDLAALRNITIEATKSHTAKKAQFSGPRVMDVLARVGVKDGSREIIVTARDGYRARIPLSELSKYEVILATRQDGKALTLETKGPIWMMYPVDKYPELNTMVTENRLVWSLVKIDVL